VKYVVDVDLSMNCGL